MGVNSSRVRYTLDAADAVTLRDIADGAETSTATEAAISLSELDQAYWQDGKEIPHGVIAVQVLVTALSYTGDEVYTLDLLVDDASGMNDTPKSVATQVITAVGAYTLYVDSKNIPLIDSDSSGTDKWMAIKATMSGSSKSLTYGAWIAKSLRG